MRIRASERTVPRGLDGLTGSVCGRAPDERGGWDYGVSIPRRRGMVFGVLEQDLESTGTMEPPDESEPVTLRVLVDPDSGDTTVLDADGEVVEPPVEDENLGLEFFTLVAVENPVDPAGDRHNGVVVGRAQRPDGTWRYAVLLENDGVWAFEREQFWARGWTMPGTLLDNPRPPGIDELEQTEALPFIAAWQAPAPAFGYDQEVRVLDRPHSEPVVGRVGRVITEHLHDSMRWSYFVILDDDPKAEIQYVTVAENDLQATGNYGEGYNTPQAWLG